MTQLFIVKDNQERANYLSEKNWERINYISEKKDWKKNEKNNIAIALNVLYAQNKKE